MELSRHAQQRMLSRSISKELIKLVLQYGRVEFNRGCEVYKLSQRAINFISADLGTHCLSLSKAYKVYVVCKETLIITVGYKTKRFKKDRS